MELWVIMLDVNLGKLVLLEVHRLENAKIVKKYFPILKWGVLYIVGKLKRAFQQAKEHTRYLLREIQPPES